jgi:hypothetical protein
MTKQKPPSLPIRPHTYVADLAEAADWEGNRLCMGCHLPERSRVHDYKPPKDNSARIIGESGD